MSFLVPSSTDRNPVLVTARPAGSDDSLGPLREEHYRALRVAIGARRPIQRAARTARGSALTTLLIGGLGAVVSLIWPSWINWVMAAGIGVIGLVEYVGAGRMRRGERSAATLLATNQLAFVLLISAYCVYQMVTAAQGGGDFGLISPELRAELAPVQGAGVNIEQQLREVAPVIAYGFYTLVIVASAIAQGGLALYYFTRRRYLAEFAAVTPAWIQRLLAEVER
jgi:hypothetical protein